MVVHNGCYGFVSPLEKVIGFFILRLIQDEQQKRVYMTDYTTEVDNTVYSNKMY